MPSPLVCCFIFPFGCFRKTNDLEPMGPMVSTATCIKEKFLLKPLYKPPSSPHPLQLLDPNACWHEHDRSVTACWSRLHPRTGTCHSSIALCWPRLDTYRMNGWDLTFWAWKEPGQIRYPRGMVVVTNLTLLAAQTVQAKMVHFCITNIGIDEDGQEKTPNEDQQLFWCLCYPSPNSSLRLGWGCGGHEAMLQNRVSQKPCSCQVFSDIAQKGFTSPETW